MDSLHVAVRVRPLLPREISSGLTSQWQCADNTIRGVCGSQYAFDHVYNDTVSDEKVYEDLAVSIVKKAMEGFHGTIFTYGQSGSGKTYSMDAIRVFAINSMYEYIENCLDREFLMRVSYIELYNEKLVDLLEDVPTTLTIREDVERNVFIEGLKEEIIVSQDHVNEVVAKGNARRRFAETKQNDRSSRAHCIFRMVIESRERDDPQNSSVYVSHLNLVDLAGSEKAGENTGMRLKEGTSINKSLLSLSLVIRKLSEEQSNAHINYRDSKLTRILQNALGGNSKTAILCTVSPSSVEETHSTLRFALNAKKVQNRPQQNEVLTDRALLKKSQHEIERLKSYIKTLEGSMPTAVQDDGELQRQREMKNKLIEQLRSFLCVSSKVKSDKRLEKKRRETVCVPQMSRIADFKDLSTVRIPSFASKPSKPTTEVQPPEVTQDDVFSPVRPSPSSLALPGIAHSLESPCQSTECQCHDLSFTDFEKAFVQDAVLQKYKARLKQLIEQNKRTKQCCRKCMPAPFVTVRSMESDESMDPKLQTSSLDITEANFGEDEDFISASDSLLEYQLEVSHDGTSLLRPKLSRKDPTSETNNEGVTSRASRRTSGNHNNLGRLDTSLLMPKLSRFSDIMEEEEDGHEEMHRSKTRREESSGDRERDITFLDISSEESEEVKALKVKLSRADLRIDTLECELQKVQHMLAERTNEIEIITTELEDRTKELKKSEKMSQLLENELMSMCRAGKFQDLSTAEKQMDEDQNGTRMLGAETGSADNNLVVGDSRTEELHRELEAMASTLVQRNTEVAALNTQLERLESVLREKSKDFQTAEELAHHLEKEFVRICDEGQDQGRLDDQKIRADSARIQELEMEVESLKATVSQRTHELEIVYTKLQDKVKDVEKSNEMAQRLESELMAKSHHEEGMDAGSVHDNEENKSQQVAVELELWKSKTEAGDARIRHLESELHERKAALGQKSAEVETLNDRLTELESILQDQLKEAEASRQLVQHLETELAEVLDKRNVETDDVESTQRKREFDVLQSAMARKDCQIEKLISKLEQMDEKAKEMEKFREWAEQLEDELASVTHEKDSEIKSLEQKVESAVARAEELQQELETAHCSLKLRNGEVDVPTTQWEEKTLRGQMSEELTENLPNEVDMTSSEQGSETKLDHMKEVVDLRVSELEKELETLKCTLEERNGEVQTLTATLEEKTMVLNNLTKHLEKDITGAEDNRESGDQMPGQQSSPDSVKIEELEKELEVVKWTLAQRDREVEKRSAKCEKSEHKLAETNAEIESLKAKLKEIETRRDSEQGLQRNAIIAGAEEITIVEEKHNIKLDQFRVEELERELAFVKSSLTEKTSEVEELSARLEEKCLELEKFSQHPVLADDNDRESIISSLEMKTRAESIRVEELEKELEISRWALNQRNEEIDSLTAMLEEKVTELEAFKDIPEYLVNQLMTGSLPDVTGDDKVEERRGELAEISHNAGGTHTVKADDSKVAELERELEALKADLLERNTEIETLTAKLAHVESDTGSSRMEALQKELEVVQSELAQRNSEVETLRAELESFRASLQEKKGDVEPSTDNKVCLKNLSTLEADTKREEVIGLQMTLHPDQFMMEEVERDLEVTKSALSQRNKEIETLQASLEVANLALRDKTEELNTVRGKVKQLESMLSTDKCHVEAEDSERGQEREWPGNDSAGTAGQNPGDVTDNTRDSRTDELEKELEQIKSALDEQHTEFEALKSRSVELESAVQEKTKELEALKELKSTLEEWNRELEGQKSKVVNLELALQERNRELETLTELKSTLEERTCKHEEQNSKLAELESVVQEKNKELEALTELVALLEKDASVTYKGQESDASPSKTMVKEENAGIVELERQLESVTVTLAERNQCIETLKTQLEELESEKSRNVQTSEIGTTRVHELEREVETLRHTVSRRDQAIETLHAQLEDLESQAVRNVDTSVTDSTGTEELRKEVETLREKLSKKNQAIETLHGQLEDLESALEEKTKGVKTFEIDGVRIDELEQEVQTLHSTLAQRHAELETLRAQLKGAEPVVKDDADVLKSSQTFAGKVEELEQELENVNAKLRQRTKDNEALYTQLEDLETALEEKIRELNTSNELRKHLENELGTIARDKQCEIESVEGKLRAESSKCAELENEMQTLQQTVSEKSTELATQTAQLENLHSVLDERTREWKTHELRLRELERTKQILESAIVQKNSEIETLQVTIEQLKVSLQEKVSESETSDEMARRLEHKFATVVSEKENEIRLLELKVKVESDRAEELEKALGSMKSHLTQRNKEVATLKAGLAEMESALTEKTKEQLAAQEKSEQLQKELTTLREEKNGSGRGETCVEGESEEQQWKDLVEEQREQLAEAKFELERLKKVIAKGREILAEKTQDLHRAQESLQVQSQEMQQLQGEMKSLQAELDRTTAECQQIQARKQQDTSDKRKLEEMMKHLKEEQRSRKIEREYHEDVIRKLKLDLRSSQAADASFQEHKVAEGRERADRAVCESRMRKIFEFENASKFMELEQLRKSDAEHKSKLASLEMQIQQLKDECASYKELSECETMRCQAAISRRKLAQYLLHKMEEQLKAVGVQPVQVDGGTKAEGQAADELPEPGVSYGQLLNMMNEKDEKWKQVATAHKVCKRLVRAMTQDMEKLESVNKELKGQVVKINAENTELRTSVDKLQSDLQNVQAPASLHHRRPQSSHSTPSKPRQAPPEVAAARQNHKAIQTEQQRTVPSMCTGGAVESFVLVSQERKIEQLNKRISKQAELLEKFGYKDTQPLKDRQHQEDSHGQPQPKSAHSKHTIDSSQVQGPEKENQLTGCS